MEERALTTETGTVETEPVVSVAQNLPDKEKKWRIARNCLLEGLLYLAVIFLTSLLFTVLKPLIGYYSVGAFAKTFIAVCLGGCVVFISYMGTTKRLKTRHVAVMILIVGYVLRVGYMLYTPATVRQHDTFSKNFDGHEAYAWTIFETGSLPTTNAYQFYHPPLNALLQSLFMHITEGVTSIFGGNFFPDAFDYGKPEYVDAQRYFLYSSCQILSVTYAFITSVLLMKMLKMFSFSDKAYLLLSAFAVLYPRHIQFAGMLNNDPLAYLFAVAALFFALRWWKGKRSPIYILLCGLSVGLGMMVKLSSATVCIPIAGIFIYEFICTLRKKEGALDFWEMVLQYGVFLCICAPIGLWFQVYAKIRFDQPLGFVFSNLNKNLYTGDHSVWARFGITFDLSEYLSSLFCLPFENYNLFNYAVKCSIFGEFQYAQGIGFGALALVFAYMGIAFLIIGGVWCVVIWCKNRKDKDSFIYKNPPMGHKDLLFAGLLIASQVLSEIYFYAKMPYGCTMDFRYIMPLIFGLALAIGFVGNTLTASGNAKAYKLNLLLNIAVVGFIVSSALFYCVCG